MANDQKVLELLHEINAIAQGVDYYEYGLPLKAKIEQLEVEIDHDRACLSMIIAIKRFLIQEAAANTPINLPCPGQLPLPLA